MLNDEPIGKLGCHKSPVNMGDFLVDTLLWDIRDDEQEISYWHEMSTVENQGTKGACVGHAYEAVKEWQEFQETGKYLQLSRQWIYEKARKKSGHKEGTTMKAGAEILREIGVPLEKYWLYTDDKINIGEPSSGADKNALIYRVNNTIYLRIKSETLLRGVLIKFGPTAIGVKVYKNWYRQEKGHIPTATFWERVQGVLGGHAICLTGHNPQTKEYEFKNSWSNRWGDEGYGYLTETEMKRIFMDGFALVDLPNEDLSSLLTVAHLSKKEQRQIWKA